MTKKSRARGCLLGQLAGDALGSLVEFKSPQGIITKYPKGITVMEDGGVWDTIAGQPTDDSEMALVLAHMLIRDKKYSPQAARKAYCEWLDTDPFDCGMTVMRGLRGDPNFKSQANGALMRVSPLGIFCSTRPSVFAQSWAIQDAKITHPNRVCQQVNALFVMAIAHAIQSGCDRKELYRIICYLSESLNTDASVKDAIFASSSPVSMAWGEKQGWVLIAFQNALHQLRYAPDLVTGISNTIMLGGDTDTNAAICGALLGAVLGEESVPQQWVNTLQNCRPKEGKSGVYNPRPKMLWPVNVLKLADALIGESHENRLEEG